MSASFLPFIPSNNCLPISVVLLIPQLTRSAFAKHCVWNGGFGFMSEVDARRQIRAQISIGRRQSVEKDGDRIRRPTLQSLGQERQVLLHERRTSINFWKEERILSNHCEDRPSIPRKRTTSLAPRETN